MVISPGEKIHVITRRLFEEDLRRHFAGTVEAATDSAARVKGYPFVFDAATGNFVRRDKERVRVIGLLEAGLIINVLPEGVRIESLRYAMDRSRNRVLTDDHGFELNISEFGASR